MAAGKGKRRANRNTVLLGSSVGACAEAAAGDNFLAEACATKVAA